MFSNSCESEKCLPQKLSDALYVGVLGAHDRPCFVLPTDGTGGAIHGHQVVMSGSLWMERSTWLNKMGMLPRVCDERHALA